MGPLSANIAVTCRHVGGGHRSRDFWSGLNPGKWTVGTRRIHPDPPMLSGPTLGETSRQPGLLGLVLERNMRRLAPIPKSWLKLELQG